MSDINTQWVDNLTAQIAAVPDCNTLSAVASQIETMMLAQIGASAEQIAVLNNLKTAPTNLTTVLNYLTALSGVYGKAYTQAVALNAALYLSYAQLIATIEAKKTTLNCSITVPTVPTPPV